MKHNYTSISLPYQQSIVEELSSPKGEFHSQHTFYKLHLILHYVLMSEKMVGAAGQSCGVLDNPGKFHKDNLCIGY